MSQVGLSHSVDRHLDGICALLDRRVNGASKVVALSHVETLRLEPQSSCRYFYLPPIGGTGRSVHIREQSNSRDTRNRLLEQLHPLTRKFDGNRAQPRNIPTWAGKAGDNAAANRIAARGHDDWDRFGGFL